MATSKNPLDNLIGAKQDAADEAFVLDEMERQSALWKRLKAHLESRLAKKRVQNDNAKLGEVQTARQRGRIAEIKYLLALDKPAPEREAEHAE